MRTFRIGLLLMLALAIASLALNGCAKPNCKEAMGNLYSKSCALFVDGEQISESDAIEGCKENQTLAKDCGCGGDFDNALECFDGLGKEECTKCNSDMDDWAQCVLDSGCLS